MDTKRIQEIANELKQHELTARRAGDYTAGAKLFNAAQELTSLVGSNNATWNPTVLHSQDM